MVAWTSTVKCYPMTGPRFLPLTVIIGFVTTVLILVEKAAKVGTTRTINVVITRMVNPNATVVTKATNLVPL